MYILCVLGKGKAQQSLTPPPWTHLPLNFFNRIILNFFERQFIDLHFIRVNYWSFMLFTFIKSFFCGVYLILTILVFLHWYLN